MSDANPIAGAVARVCKYCGAGFESVRKKRKCAACKHKRPKQYPRKYPRNRTGWYASLSKEQRLILSKRVSACKKRRRDRDPAYRIKLQMQQNAQRHRQAARQGRIVKTRVPRPEMPFEERIDLLTQANARQAWQYWLRHKATDQWVSEYYAAGSEPWRNPRLSNADAYRMRYQMDPAFAQKERERVSIRRFENPVYAMQWCKDAEGRWFRAAQSSDGSVTPELLKALRDETHCAYCHRFVERRQRVLDHVQPVALGGRHSADNLVMACAQCNRHKSCKRALDWLLGNFLGPSNLEGCGGLRPRKKPLGFTSSPAPVSFHAAASEALRA